MTITPHPHPLSLAPPNPHPPPSFIRFIYSYPAHNSGFIFSHIKRTIFSPKISAFLLLARLAPQPWIAASFDLSYPYTMSSASTAVAEAAELTVAVADTAAKAPRRFPPPCWTQDETLVLIDSYRERWYALRRGYLRTADWDAVAETVASRCPDASPAKISAQCRHKMEKLRQRYRAEKQRSATYPYPAGRFFSSWFFFDYMEAMENGTTAPAEKSGNSGEGIDPSPYPDQNSLKLKLKSKNSTDSSPDFVFYSGVKQNKFNPDTTKISNYPPSYLEEEDMPPDENPVNSRSTKLLLNGIPKNFPKNVEFSNGFHREMLPPGLRVKRNEKNPNQECWGNSFVAPSYRLAAAPDGLQRRRHAVEEMVESINFLGEGYLKMERAKMELAREMEGSRREMEKKRNELILESQKKIVDVFVKGLSEMKRIKKTKFDEADAEEKSH